MQATLLGMGIAIILALVAALVGPYFVDWGQFRSTFEAEATRLVGAPVRIAGPIDLRILPTPTLTLRQIELGAGNDPHVAARELHIEAALGPLVRGEVRAAQLRVVAPELRLGIDANGRIDLPGAAVGFSPDRLAVERIAIENGRAVLSDTASGAELDLEGLWFMGELRSLIGPVKGEGGFSAAGERYGYRLSAGRLADDGTMKVRLAVDPNDRPLTIETEGQVRFEAGTPRFEGTLSVARLAGVALPGGPGVATTPWRATSRVKASAKRALLEDIEYQYGPEERALKLAGTAEVSFGRFPRAEGILTARQVDLDHTLTLPEDVRRLPLAAVRSLIAPFGTTYRPPFPVKLGIGIDTVTLAGGTLLAVRGDLKTAGDGWDLETFEFRAPGFAQVRLSGHLALAREDVAFKGPIRIEASDPKAFLAWLDGRSGASPMLTGALKVAGDVTIGGQEIAVDRLKAEVDRKIIEGRLAYAWARGDRPPRLDAELRAAELDVDGVIGFARSALAGSAFEWPGEIGLAVEVNRATFAGFDAKGVSAKLKLDAAGLAIDRARIADLGETAFDLSGRIDGPLASPRGRLTLDVDGRNLEAASAVLGHIAPRAAEQLRQIGPRFVPLRVRTVLQVDQAPSGAPGPSTARLTLAGTAKGAQVRLAADVTGDMATRSVPALSLDGEITNADGSVVLALLGLDETVAVDRRPGSLKITARGAAEGDMTVEARLAAGGLEASAAGTVHGIGGEGRTADLAINLRAADAAPLARAYALAVNAPLPVGLRMRVRSAGEIVIDDLAGTVARVPLRGRLKLSPDASRFDGHLDLDALDGPALVAAIAGIPRRGARREMWSAEPFGDGLFGKLQGYLDVRVARSPLMPGLDARELSATLKLAETEIALRDVKGKVDTGRLAGELTLQRRDGLDARGRITLTDVEAGALLPDNARGAVTGRVSLHAEAAGSGLSPAALVGSLRGSGTLTASEIELAGLNPRTFEAVTEAVDKGLTIDSARLTGVIGTILDGGRLAVPRLDAAFTINGGHVRLGNTVVKGRGADLTLAGSANLSDGSIESRLTLSGPATEEVAVRPDVVVTLKGPAGAPKRTVDVAALSGWLMLRSIERQAKQLDAMEAERRERERAGVGPVAPVQAAAPTETPSENEKPRPAPRAPRVAPPSIERTPLPPPLQIGPEQGRRSRSSEPDASQNAPPSGFLPPAAYSRPLSSDPLINPQR